MKPPHKLTQLIIVLIAFVGCSVDNSQLELNKKLVTDYVKEEDAGSKDFVEKYVDPDFVFYYPNGVEFRGIDDLKKGAAELQAAFPDLNHQIHDQVAEEDKVATRYTITGTHKGEYNGVAPTNKQLRVTMIDICRIKNGKIVEGWIEFDPTAFNQILTSE